MKKILPILLLLLPYFISAQYNASEGEFNVRLQGTGTTNLSFSGMAPSATVRGDIPAALAAEFQSALEDFQEDEGLVGLSAAINIDGDQWTGTVGISSTTEDINDEMILAIGSVSKSITAACILQMVEDDLLELNAEIGTILDLTAYDNIPPQVTVRQLLNHSSGIYNYTDFPTFGDSINAQLNRIWTPEELLERFVGAPYFTPGTNWTYSNTNYILAGMVIEEVSGQAYHLEVRERIIEPLGLTSMVLPPYEELNNEIAHLWFDLFGTGTPVDMNAFNVPLDALLSAAWAAGAYVATPTESSLWMKALQEGEVFDTDILNEEMRDIFPFVGSPVYQGYGLGVFLAELDCSEEVWGHGGDILYSSQVHYFPEDILSIAVHTNDGEKDSGVLVPIVEELQCIYKNYLSTSVSETEQDQFNIQIAPNPLRDQIQLSWEQPKAATVRIELFNAMGQSVQTLLQAHQSAGTHQQTWNLDLSSGIYLLKLQVGAQSSTQKLIRS